MSSPRNIRADAVFAIDTHRFLAAEIILLNQYIIRRSSYETYQQHFKSNPFNGEGCALTDADAQGRQRVAAFFLLQRSHGGEHQARARGT